MNKRLLPLYVAFIILALDAATKYWTHTHLPLMQRDTLWYPYGGIGVFKDFFGVEFSISHQINHGAAWGYFKQYQLPLLYVRIVLILALVGYALIFNKNSRLNIPFAMIIAGAVGNVIDYFMYGHVVDMIHFVLWGYDFPVFNIADSSIFLGICWFFLATPKEEAAVKKRGR